MPKSQKNYLVGLYLMALSLLCLQCFGGDGLGGNVDGKGGLDSYTLSTVVNQHLKKILLELRRGNKNNINKKDEDGNSSLHLALKENLAKDRKHALLSYLLKKGADINAQDDEGNTPLNALLQENCPDKGTVKLLLKQKKIDVDKANKKGITPLTYATKSYSKDILEPLLEKAPSMEAVDKKGNTIFHQLAARHSPELLDKLELLLDAPKTDAAVLRIKNKEGHLVLHTILLGDGIITRSNQEKAFRMVIDKMKEEFKKSGITEQQCRDMFGYHAKAIHNKTPSWSWIKDKSAFYASEYQRLLDMEQELYTHLSSS